MTSDIHLGWSKCWFKRGNISLAHRFLIRYSDSYGTPPRGIIRCSSSGSFFIFQISLVNNGFHYFYTRNDDVTSRSPRAQLTVQIEQCAWLQTGKRKGAVSLVSCDVWRPFWTVLCGLLLLLNGICPTHVVWIFLSLMLQSFDRFLYIPNTKIFEGSSSAFFWNRND